ncbi:MAG: DinB family protein [Anaerolineae bacterium]
MAESYLACLFEHNCWANEQVIQACSGLTDEQLDAVPRSATVGTIRATLLHLVKSEQAYLRLLTGTEPDLHWDAPPRFDELLESVRTTGAGFVAVAHGDAAERLAGRIQTRDGYLTEPWVVIAQIINHGAEHREQIKSMLSALGMTPPETDGWSYGEATQALVPITR